VLPPGAEVHHEVELAVVMGHRVKTVQPNRARECVAGYAVAIDLTARNWQSEAKAKGEPWTLSKGYDTFAPVGPFLRASDVGDSIDKAQIWLSINGDLRQKGSVQDMTFDIDELISFISSKMTLERGDLILTGTPHGVGPVRPGDKIRVGLTSEATESTADFHCVLGTPTSKWTK